MNYNTRSVIKDIALVDTLQVSAYTIPTTLPESDGTIKWNSTTLVLVEIEAAGKKGIGYTYASSSAAHYIKNTLASIVIGRDVMNIPAITGYLIQEVRNNGAVGIAMMAVSAIDNALWDLKAKILELPLCTLLGQVKSSMLLYGSGGFTSYSDLQLKSQFESWAAEGIKYMKMKIGRDAGMDPHRVAYAKEVIGDNIQLFVDANGAYTVKQALQMAEVFTAQHVSWFEEPVTSDNLKGLHFIREHAPAMMNISAGEYGYTLQYFEAMLSAGAVDVLQADATRCGGITNFLKAGYLAEAYQLPFSSHCAPSLHLHAALALPAFYIAEYFYDHARIEQLLFDGVASVIDGTLAPDYSRPGLGLDFKHTDALKYKI
ncbi:MAG: enolase C-terminal domain-like protein [Flavipsychrobacter sp.]